MEKADALIYRTGLSFLRTHRSPKTLLHQEVLCDNDRQPAAADAGLLNLHFCTRPMKEPELPGWGGEKAANSQSQWESTRHHSWDRTTMREIRRNELVYKTQDSWKGEERGKSGVSCWRAHTAVYKIAKQQGPTEQYREVYSASCNNLKR